MKVQTSQLNRAGFTLLELLVVVAILAVIAGGLIASYDGLDTQASQGVSTFNIKGVDQALRQYSAVNRQQPSQFDSLLFSAAGTGADGVALGILNNNLSGALATYTLTADGVNSLTSVGITHLMYVNGDEDYNEALGDYVNGTTNHSIPNRVFDVPEFGWGISLVPAVGVRVAQIDTNLSNDAARALRNYLKVGATDIVVALGVGSSSTLIKPEHGRAALSEAPVCGNVRKDQYSRYIALYHISEDGAEFEPAHLVGVIDAAGQYFDQAHSAAIGN